MRSKRGAHNIEAQTSGCVNNYNCNDSIDNVNTKCSGNSKHSVWENQNCSVEELTVKLGIPER